MPTPVTVSFPALTDPQIAFANIAAWNAYFGSIQFTLVSANLPNADTANIGAVLKATSTAATTSSWTAQSYAADYYATLTQVDSGGTPTSVFVPTKDSFDKLKQNLDQLKALYDSMVVALQNAGIMST